MSSRRRSEKNENHSVVYIYIDLAEIFYDIAAGRLVEMTVPVFRPPNRIHNIHIRLARASVRLILNTRVKSPDGFREPFAALVFSTSR